MKTLLISAFSLSACAASCLSQTYVSEASGVTDSNNQTVTQLFGSAGNPSAGPVAVSQTLLLGPPDDNEWVSFTQGQEAIFGFGNFAAVNSVFVAVLGAGADETGKLYGREHIGDPWVLLGTLSEPYLGFLPPPNIQVFSLAGSGLPRVNQVKIVSESSAGSFPGLDVLAIGADNVITIAGAEFDQATIYAAVELSWHTVSGQRYQVQSTLSLDQPIWIDFGQPIVGDGAEKSLFDQTRNRDKHFYRVMKLP